MAVAPRTIPDLALLVAGLSSPFEDEISARAAGAALDDPNVQDTLRDLYPRLVRKKTITHALSHLERAGADLDAITIPESLFASAYPLNRIMAPPAATRSGEISLASIGRSLARHQELIERVIVELAGAGSDRLILAKGQAYRARYPGYHRYSSDLDVFVPSWDDAISVLRLLCRQMGFALHGCKVGAVAVLKSFRRTAGHELNVGLYAGGFPTPLLSLPFRLGVADPSRAGAVEVGGARVLACSVEDLLLSSALRPLLDREVAGRALNDARYLLRSDGMNLDWDYVVATAARNELQAFLLGLVRSAERTDGRELVPPEAILRLGSEAKPLGTRSWLIRYARASLGPVRGPRFVILDRLQVRLFRAEIGLRRRGGAGRTAAASIMALLRPRFRAVCELRSEPAPAELGYCLSRLRRGRRAGQAEALVGFLPDRGQESLLRKRTTVGDVHAQPHRCEAFLVSRARPR